MVIVMRRSGILITDGHLVMMLWMEVSRMSRSSRVEPEAAVIARDVG
jgi:hypothetical protein